MSYTYSKSTDHTETVPMKTQNTAKQQALNEAQSTCDGLHRLMRKLSDAATDMDRGGNSSYELQALIASANSCVLNLATLLAVVDSDEQTNVHPLKRDESIITENTRSKKPG